jgi:hypothetical protein
MLLLNPPAFNTPEDIANRAVDHMGADHSITSLLTDGSKAQRVILGMYNKLRQAELRRNDWKFSMRHAVLRALDTTSMLWTPPAWSNGSTYRVGQVVSYDDGYGSRYWINVKPANLNNAPGGSANAWDNYFGPLVVPLWSAGTAYFPVDTVYMSNHLGTFSLYTSLQNGNTEEPDTTDAYVSTVTYTKDQVVSYLAQDYISLVDGNLGNTPATSPTQWAVTAIAGSLNWVTQGGTLVQLNIMYPLGSGPLSNQNSSNVFPLPYGFLRNAVQDPKAGAVSIFGAPAYRMPTDWIIEGPYILSNDAGPLVYRFVGDTSVISGFDPMFCEGLAARIGVEACESVTGSTEKLKTISQLYGGAIRDARLVNGIENGAVQSELDDWIGCRM